MELSEQNRALIERMRQDTHTRLELDDPNTLIASGVIDLNALLDEARAEGYRRALTGNANPSGFQDRLR